MTLFSLPFAKLGGDFYLAGNLTLFVIGGIGSDWQQIIAALLFTTAALIYSRRGDRDDWFRTACLLCIPGMILANWQSLKLFEPATCIGTALYISGQILGVASRNLSGRFHASTSVFARQMLGESRKGMGILNVSSRGFMCIDAIAQSNWGFVGVLCLWSLGDILVGLSRTQSAPTSPRQ